MINKFQRPGLSAGLFIAILAVAILAVAIPPGAHALQPKTSEIPTTQPRASFTRASATPASAPAPSAAKSERPIPFHGKIAIVNPNSKEITLASRKGAGRILKVTDKTVLTKGGKPAKFSDVVKDEEIRGSYWKRPDGSLEARSVKLGPLTEAEQAAKTAKAGKTKPIP